MGEGIAGLHKFVRQRYGDVEAVRVPCATTLLVDGEGLVARLLGGDRFDLGGDYARLDAAARGCVGALRDAGYRRLTVYRPGRRTLARPAARERRAKKRRAAWKALEAGERGDLPPPVLAGRVVYAALEALGVDVVDCEGEAAPDLARAARRARDRLVLGDDSSFLLFEGVRWAPLTEALATLSAGLAVPVWTRATLAAKMVRRSAGVSSSVSRARGRPPSSVGPPRGPRRRPRRARRRRPHGALRRARPRRRRHRGGGHRRGPSPAHGPDQVPARVKNKIFMVDGELI
jgi:hypothetical protein